MARTIVKFRKNADADRNLALLDTNRFAAQLYNNLVVAQDSNGYSLGIQYAKEYLLSKLPANYLKFFWVNGSHVFDDFRAFNGKLKESNMYIKREKPYAILIPTVEYDYDNENVDLYNAGADIFLKRSDYQRSFFKDYDKRVFLGIQMHLLKMNFQFKIRVSTRAEELDLFRRMQLVYRIGATHSEDISCDFVIPYELIRNIASLTGFEIDDKGEVKDPLAFQAYMNKHSDIPVMYKFRAINGHNEFFMRMSHLYFHTTTKDALDVDDGEREGQLDNNYTVTMQFSMKFPVPHFFVLYNEKMIPYPLQTKDTNNILMYSIAQFIIPNTNDKGWNQVINTVYMTDDHEMEFDIHQMFLSNKTEDIRKVINYCIANHISPKVFIDTHIYRECGGSYVRVPCELEYRSMNEVVVKLGEDLGDAQYLYLGIYIDMKFMNETLITVNEFEKDRMSKL